MTVKLKNATILNMNMAAKIIEIRKISGLTQNGLAAKLFVTRQAVSRWENGETTPTVDTLKRSCCTEGRDGKSSLFFLSV